ncbi:MAG: FliM/FliN family flagellar motor switch protein, partial [Gaiellaceae bacterium]
LRPGSVVELDAPASAGVVLVAENTPIHRARPGRSGRRRAVEIVERLEVSG